MGIRVTFAMGLYNNIDTLDKCMESVINQTYKEWEMIICDDCSTDGSYEKAISYAEKYPNIRVLRNEKNSGLAYSLNQCISNANGEYIARQDADDESLPERIQNEVDFLDTHPQYSMVGTCYIRFDGQGNESPIKAKEIIKPYDLIWDCYFCHPTTLFRKEALEKVGMYTVRKETKRSEDYDLILKLYASGYRAYNMQEYLFYYRTDLNSYKRSHVLERRIEEMWIRYNGYKLNKFPLWAYVFVLKPLIVGLLPHWFMKRYYQNKFFNNKAAN